MHATVAYGGQRTTCTSLLSPPLCGFKAQTLVLMLGCPSLLAEPGIHGLLGIHAPQSRCENERMCVCDVAKYGDDEVLVSLSARLGSL